jgi:hypothetical protein
MEKKESSFISSRRQFLLKNLTTGTLLCLGCHSLFTSNIKAGPTKLLVQTSEDISTQGMASEDVVRFALDYCIPLFQKLEKKVGKEIFIQMLRRASTENISEMIADVTKGMPVKDMNAFANFLQEYLSTPPYDKSFVYEIVEKTDKAFELKYTRCLMAEIYRNKNAADIGYAIECFPADAAAKAFNPKMKATGTTNMMKGDSFCLERFELET